MATKLEKLVAEAVELEIPLTGNETQKEIQDLIAEKKAGDNGEESDKKSKKIFYWVKVKSFISDDETVEIGLYETTTPNDRLDRSEKLYVEKFVGKLPDIKLQEIAKLFRVSIFEKNGEETRPSAEVLAELVKVL